MGTSAPCKCKNKMVKQDLESVYNKMHRVQSAGVVPQLKDAQCSKQDDPQQNIQSSRRKSGSPNPSRQDGEGDGSAGVGRPKQAQSSWQNKDISLKLRGSCEL